ncbi:MAG: M48 family metalloprotease [Candidatus Latescibacteria bacterium]|nr:M48 family metalloprotease [Candidatus Latescibacterota bacterium]
MKIFLPLLLAFQLVTGCTSTRQFLGTTLISTEDEIALGQKVAAQVEQQHRMHPDPALQRYVRNIALDLARYSEADRPGITYHIKVIDDPKQVNAFAVPGGYLYVYTGLLLAAANEAEVAGVMAHEIGHIVGRHSANQLATQHGIDIFTTLILGEDPAALGQIAAQFGTAGALADFSRDDELESDKFGVKYLIACGYDPRGLLSFFEKLKAMEGGRPSDLEAFFSTHPPTDERIRRIERLVEKAGNPTGDKHQARFLRATAGLRR